MKTQIRAVLCASALVAGLALANAADVQPAQTNLPPGTVVTPVVAAQPAPAVAKDPAPPAQPTNGIAAPAQAIPSTLVREITLTDSGCEATFGLHKAFFHSDIAASNPVKVTGPDMRAIYFRPSFLTLVKRSTDEVHLLGSVTNTIGVAYPDSVVWSNVCGTAIYEPTFVENGVTVFVLGESEIRFWQTSQWTVAARQAARKSRRSGFSI